MDPLLTPNPSRFEQLRARVAAQVAAGVPRDDALADLEPEDLLVLLMGMDTHLDPSEADAMFQGAVGGAELDGTDDDIPLPSARSAAAEVIALRDARPAQSTAAREAAAAPEPTRTTSWGRWAVALAAAVVVALALWAVFGQRGPADPSAEGGSSPGGGRLGEGIKGVGGDAGALEDGARLRVFRGAISEPGRAPEVRGELSDGGAVSVGDAVLFRLGVTRRAHAALVVWTPDRGVRALWTTPAGSPLEAGEHELSARGQALAFVPKAGAVRFALVTHDAPLGEQVWPEALTAEAIGRACPSCRATFKGVVCGAP